MLLKIFSENPAQKQIDKVVDCLKNGGIIICPTDTVYAIACDLYNTKAVAKVAKIKGIKPEKANFSLICSDLGHISKYAKPISNNVYKLMKKVLPGPFTFILEANNNVPKLFQHKKKSIGIRVPDNNIALEIIKTLGNPMVSTSVKDDDEIIEYTTDPELIHEKYGNQVDIVIDGGYGDNEGSTVIDCSDDEINIIREGKGKISIY
ncbi:MAG: threonylcarbamoyl-AMP synthase [Bacteroidetes bacterium HGW-Bacteroidetes-15]|nr:MAG: threonylcarbamoyl-AMP synthase [Bacteroidetes bacterium HGW-Bacteroidetes-15]